MRLRESRRILESRTRVDEGRIVKGRAQQFCRPPQPPNRAQQPNSVAPPAAAAARSNRLKVPSCPPPLLAISAPPGPGPTPLPSALPPRTPHTSAPLGRPASPPPNRPPVTVQEERSGRVTTTDMSRLMNMSAKIAKAIEAYRSHRVCALVVGVVWARGTSPRAMLGRAL